MDVVAKPQLSHLELGVVPLCIAFASVAVAIDITATNLNPAPDEGVYWQSLRAMGAGYHLYKQIFYSQPPLFLMSIYPFYELLGSTITSARIGVAALSFLGLLGAYLMGKALAGRAAGVGAVVLLMITPMYLEQSHILRAEGPAIGTKAGLGPDGVLQHAPVTGLQLVAAVEAERRIAPAGHALPPCTAARTTSGMSSSEMEL